MSTTHIEKFIIDGEEAWQNKEPAFHHKFVSANQYWAVFLDANGTEYTVSLAEFLIDPKHWRAVGEKRGWPVIHMVNMNRGEEQSQHYWLFMQHVFIDYLADGKSIDQALEALNN